MPARLSRLAVALCLPFALAACSLEELVSASLEGWNLVLVSFSQVDSSGITGLGNGDFNDGETGFDFGAHFSPTVVGQSYVAHIHTGSCTTIGPMVRALPPVVGQPAINGGLPSAFVRVSLPTSYSKAAYVMDLHVTVAGVERRVACGSFT
ncbi:MAG: hypothetical protein IPK85_09705 [Gemmatimonadetes bacterium]|nr:hypothetical protein [Gemmatimonadota bacterium]